VIDLDPYPHVQTSVLNYGLPDLAGKAAGHRMMQQRARDIRDAIRIFEPRIDRNSLSVEPQRADANANAVSYVINCDVTNAVQAMPVKFKTEIEAETANVKVRD
jgi:type VI secretion system protein ImpF